MTFRGNAASYSNRDPVRKQQEQPTFPQQGGNSCKSHKGLVIHAMVRQKRNIPKRGDSTAQEHGNRDLMLVQEQIAQSRGVLRNLLARTAAQMPGLIGKGNRKGHSMDPKCRHILRGFSKLFGGGTHVQILHGKGSL